MTADIHTCSYYCERPGCIRAQRDELRDRMESALAKQPPSAPVGANVRKAGEVSPYSDVVLVADLAQQPASVGEEIMVNAAHGVFTLPLQPSGLLSGPRFVVHVPGPEQPAAPDVEAMVEALEAALMVMTSKEVRLEKQADAITMVRSQLARLRDAAPAAQAPRACTCHPDDRPDGPCRERYAASECQALAAQEQPPADDEVVFYDGVGAARSSVKSCRDGVRWIKVGDRIYWPLSDSDAKRLQSACCGNGSFDGPATPAGEGEQQ